MRNGSIMLYRLLPLGLANKRRSRRFHAGQLVEVRVTAPGYIGRVVRYRLKKGREPVGRALCLVPGAEQPSQCATPRGRGPWLRIVDSVTAPTFKTASTAKGMVKRESF
jgi:hypothetical protein